MKIGIKNSITSGDEIIFDNVEYSQYLTICELAKGNNTIVIIYDFKTEE